MDYMYYIVLLVQKVNNLYLVSNLNFYTAGHNFYLSVGI